ncbi:MAG TPA: cytochrome c [Vicinamibacteria bacterium]|jgi:mono/diheme cytochrome c family protein|nr:cytochrome c [Vicinamibacteria bacterium]
MFPVNRPALLVVVGSAGLAAAALAPVISSESGSTLYRSYCASCHGTSAKGDGPLAANLRTAPSDLTRLAKRNHGKFDAEKVRRAIDGRDAREIHGGTDMPVWGDAFKRAGEGYDEAKVKERINALVDHIATLQER